MTTTSDIIYDAIALYMIDGSDAIDKLSTRLGIRRSHIMTDMNDYGLISAESIERMTEEEYETALADCTASIVQSIE